MVLHLQLSICILNLLSMYLNTFFKINLAKNFKCTSSTYLHLTKLNIIIHISPITSPIKNNFKLFKYNNKPHHHLIHQIHVILPHPRVQRGLLDGGPAQDVPSGAALGPPHGGHQLPGQQQHARRHQPQRTHQGHRVARWHHCTRAYGFRAVSIVCKENIIDLNNLKPTFLKSRL